MLGNNNYWIAAAAQKWNLPVVTADCRDFDPQTNFNSITA